MLMKQFGFIQCTQEKNLWLRGRILKRCILVTYLVRNKVRFCPANHLRKNEEKIVTNSMPRNFFNFRSKELTCNFGITSDPTEL